MCIKTIGERLERIKKSGRKIKDEDILHAFEQAKKQEYKRVQRLYDRAKSIASNSFAYFITLTYDNEHIENANVEHARRWAKKHMTRFFGNDDFGSENGRYHHHIFGNLKTKDIDLRASWNYGAINILPYKGGTKAITKYIDRLSKHAVKCKTINLFRSKET